jgi:hypothetical protein
MQPLEPEEAAAQNAQQAAELEIPKPQECRTFASLSSFCGTADCSPGPSGGTDVSSDSNAAGMLSMSDEELIASLAGCAAPAAQHTPHEEPHLSKSRTSSRAEVPAEQSIILHVDDEAVSPDCQTCCEFLHLEGCANDAQREVNFFV